MQTIRQAESGFKFLVRNMCSVGEAPYIITGVYDDGEEFRSYQTGYSRSDAVKEFKQYHTPFTLISVKRVAK